MPAESDIAPQTEDSQSFERKELVDVEEAVVPEEHTVHSRDCSCPQHSQLHHVLKIAVEEERQNDQIHTEQLTYVFPVGSRRGLMSSFLKCAKKSSQGLAS